MAVKARLQLGRFGRRRCDLHACATLSSETNRPTRARVIGLLPSFKVDWLIQRHWSYTLIRSRLQTGRYLKETPPGKNTNYVTSRVTFKF